jgi:Tfp pilus assembly protein PilF
LNRKERRIAQAKEKKAPRNPSVPRRYRLPADLHATAITSFQMGKPHEAIALLDRVIALNPNHVDAHIDRGNILIHLQQYAAALVSYDNALAIKPNYAEVYCNRGEALHRLRRYDEAIDNYKKTISLNPNYAGAYNNMGAAFGELKQYHNALENYDKAIAINPSQADAYNSKALIKLTFGEYDEGWKLHEWRWNKTNPPVARKFVKPLWLGGESLSGKTILLHAEQGLGDTIQFCRYAPLVEAMGARVIIEVQPPLVSVISTINDSLNVIAQEESIPAFDFHCPLMSLPLALGTTLDTIPADIPYLYANIKKLKEWQERLGDKTSNRIGLAWSGSTKHQNDHRRSISLRLLTSLLESNCEFHSLQKEVRPDDAPVLANSRIISHAHDLKDFTDTAALVSEMDLIISVDTSVAHLAGALGKPVWVLIAFVPDFRWMDERDNSPWYPTARLFRQQQAGDWESVIESVRKEIDIFNQSFLIRRNSGPNR